MGRARKDDRQGGWVRKEDGAAREWETVHRRGSEDDEDEERAAEGPKDVVERRAPSCDAVGAFSGDGASAIVHKIMK